MMDINQLYEMIQGLQNELNHKNNQIIDLENTLNEQAQLIAQIEDCENDGFWDKIKNQIDSQIQEKIDALREALKRL